MLHQNRNVTSKQEYYIKTGMLHQNRNITSKQEYYIKTGMLHQNRNITSKHHVAIFNVLRTKIKLNRV